MDIEALRRINELTKALQEHGMSASSQEALEQAENILQPIQERSKTSTVAVQTEQQSSDALLERKYKLLLEMNNKKFEETISTLQNNMNTLSQEIARLKSEMSLLDAKRIVAEQAKPEIVQAPKETPAVEQKKEAHPRQGSFEPGDISIEKMFYFGHK